MPLALHYTDLTYYNVHLDPIISYERPKTSSNIAKLVLVFVLVSSPYTLPLSLCVNIWFHILVVILL